MIQNVNAAFAIRAFSTTLQSQEQGFNQLLRQFPAGQTLLSGNQFPMDSVEIGFAALGKSSLIPSSRLTGDAGGEFAAFNLPNNENQFGSSPVGSDTSYFSSLGAIIDILA